MATLPSILIPTRAQMSDVRKDNKLEVNFGNGYTQRGANGINTLAREVSITWIGSVADIQEYINFFDDLQGYQTFQWTHPRESIQRNWVVGDRTITDLSEELRQLSTTFKVDYSLAT